MRGHVVSSRTILGAAYRRCVVGRLAALGLVLVGVLALNAAAASAAECFSCGVPPTMQIGTPVGVAVNQMSGNVYVADEENRRIDEFTGNGTFISAFGLGVATGVDAFEVCTTDCKVGLSGFKPVSVAVDNSPGLSSEDVYVADGGSYRVEHFASDGQFILTFGREVNATTHGNVCLAGETCQAGLKGSGAGELGSTAPPVTVDATGDVWVGDTDRLEEFSAAGGFISEVKLPGAGVVQALAMDSDGNFYIKSTGVAGIQKLEPSGTPFPSPYPLDTSGTPRAFGLDGSGDLFVSDQEGTGTGSATLLEYSSAGVELEAFGTGEVVGRPEGNALAVGPGGAVFVVSCTSGEESAVQSFVLPPAGPLVELRTVGASPAGNGGVKLKATINPEGAETDYHFLYISEAAYQQNIKESLPGFNGASVAPGGSISDNLFSWHSVESTVSGVAAGTAYHFRAVASNVNGAGNSAEAEIGLFSTQPLAPIVSSESASNVTDSSATLQAQIQPGSENTTYYFEYGTSTCEANACGTKTAPEGGPLGSLNPETATFELTGLKSNTTYHYWAVAKNNAAPGGVHGEAMEFTTPKSAEEEGWFKKFAEENAKKVAEEAAAREAATNQEAAAKKHQEEEAVAAAGKRKQEEEAGAAAAKKKQEEEAASKHAPVAKVVAPKVLTKAQKLAKALRVCKKEPKRKQASCEKQAKKKYGGAGRKASKRRK
jgi:hypothetical protein